MVVLPPRYSRGRAHPVEVKREMIEWWGPIIEEYYAGSERNGSTRITAKSGSANRSWEGLVTVRFTFATRMGVSYRLVKRVPSISNRRWPHLFITTIVTRRTTLTPQKPIVEHWETSVT